jgi:hypothetical protein
VLPIDEDDKKIYKMMEPKTIASVVYAAKWLIYSHVFEAGLFLYVVYEARHYGMDSLDVVIVRAGDTDQHTHARYVVKYIPCMNSSNTAIKRQTMGCRIHTSEHCMHSVLIGRNYLADIVRNVYQYLHTVAFCLYPNTDYDYHMRELASLHLVVVSKYLIKQFINSTRLLYKNTRVVIKCNCHKSDCVCKLVVNHFSL